MGTAISVGLIVALPGWTKVFAVIFLIAGSYYLASYLGNVLAQNYAYHAGTAAVRPALAGVPPRPRKRNGR